MPRFITRLPALVILAGAIVMLTEHARAAEPPLAGKWTFKDVSNGKEVTLAVIQVEEKDGKTTATVLSAPLFDDELTLKDVRVDGRSINFKFEAGPGLITVNAAAVGTDKEPKVLRGTIQFGSRTLPAEFARTEAKKISREDATKAGPASQALQNARRADKGRPAALAEVAKEFAGTGAAYAAAEELFRDAVMDGAKNEDLRAAADSFIQAAMPFGQALRDNVTLTVAQTLAKAEKVTPVAVEFARKAEKALTPDASLSHTAAVLKTLEVALRKTGKEAEAKELLARIDKIENDLDVEFEKTGIPFKPELFKGRKGKSSRIAVVELFTGAHCPPCVAADVAFDAALKTYKPTDVVLLEYHLHIPGPDPLTNADSEKRAEYYGDVIQGTPTTIINGKGTEEGLGGGKGASKDSFDTLRNAVEKALESEDQGNVKLSAERKGNNIDVKAAVSDLKKTGEKVRLRFVLVEDVVRYQGTNGQRLHHHIVRAFPGGVEGFALKDAQSEQTVKVALDEVRRGLTDYLAAANKTRPFLDDERPVELKHLKIIALIQDDATKEILNAAQVDVPEGK